jgi:hypothetical protein
MRGAQACLSPIFGAFISPVSWHLWHCALTTSSPLRSGGDDLHPGHGLDDLVGLFFGGLVGTALAGGERNGRGEGRQQQNPAGPAVGLIVRHCVLPERYGRNLRLYAFRRLSRPPELKQDSTRSPAENHIYLRIAVQQFIDLIQTGRYTHKVFRWRSR